MMSIYTYKDFIESISRDGEQKLSQEKVLSRITENLSSATIEFCLPSVRCALRDRLLALNFLISSGRGIPIVRAISDLYPPALRSAWQDGRAGSSSSQLHNRGNPSGPKTRATLQYTAAVRQHYTERCREYSGAPSQPFLFHQKIYQDVCDWATIPDNIRVLCVHHPLANGESHKLLYLYHESPKTSVTDSWSLIEKNIIYARARIKPPTMARWTRITYENYTKQHKDHHDAFLNLMKDLRETHLKLLAEFCSGRVLLDRFLLLWRKKP